MRYLPLAFDIAGRRCLIVGGGHIALRKTSLLVRAGAIPIVVAPDISSELSALVLQHNGDVVHREFAVDDIDDQYCLIVAATDNHSLNTQVAELARTHHVPVNVVDTPELCSFVFPAIIERAPLTIAISSAGASPVLARLLRSRLEIMIPQAYGDLAALAGRLRDRVKQQVESSRERRRFWESALQGPAAEMVFVGRNDDAERFLLSQLSTPGMNTRGEVWLVGAGPGNAELLTLKALRLMQQADVVLYDRLVSDDVMKLVRQDAERIYVGKSRKQHAVPQQDINHLLVTLAQQGKRVLRLKGGDPFIFGRGGEEITELASKGIPFQVVPGITAANGCAAYAGIPLTHRDYAQSVRFITGHLQEDQTNLQWAELLDTSQTLVFYMSLIGLSSICQQLITHGRDAQTSVALVEKGTTTEQRVVIGTLATIAQQVEQMNVTAPTLTIVGDVVKLHEQLKWFDTNDNS